ncbi:MAG: hypothetical protein HWE22_10270 [Flavobacteriales bacterium]|nr:hypothetical protein [Flavobacteriales bacterium]
MTQTAYSIISIAVAIIAFGIILYIGLKTDILKESVPKLQLKDRMYSLGRFQLWVWTLIICPLFLLYWGFNPLHTIDLNTTAVILLGIPAGVAVTSGVISSSQSSDMTESDHARSEALAENPQLKTQEHQEMVRAAADPSTATKEVAPADRQPAPNVLKMHQKSKSFFIDLISDDEGQLSIGRLQQLVFTMAFLIVYLTTFFGAEMHKLPVFEAQVFTLMGISSGTYLVAKGMNK